MKQAGDIRKTKDGYEAVFARELRHSPERVWNMLTDPASRALWFVRTEIEPRLGGTIVEHHSHAGEDAIGRGTITRFEPPRVFEHTWWDEEFADVGRRNVIRWELQPLGTGTRLVLTHQFPELEGVWGSMAGWHIYVEVLAEILDGGDPKQHAPPRGELRAGAFVETTPGRGAWTQRAHLESRYREAVDALSRDARTGGAINGTVGMTLHAHDLPRATEFWQAMGLPVTAKDENFASLAVPGSGPLVLHKWATACEHNGGRPPGTVSAADDATSATRPVPARASAATSPGVARPTRSATSRRVSSAFFRHKTRSAAKRGERKAYFATKKAFGRSRVRGAGHTRRW